VNPYDSLVVEFVSVVLATLEQDELIHRQQFEALQKQEVDSSRLFEKTKREEDSRTMRIMTLAQKTLEARIRIQKQGEAEREKLVMKMQAIEGQMRRFQERRQQIKISTHQAHLNSIRDHEFSTQRKERIVLGGEEKLAAQLQKYEEQAKRVRLHLVYHLQDCFSEMRLSFLQMKLLQQQQQERIRANAEIRDQRMNQRKNFADVIDREFR
jgi:type II secretory pathway predicted ATPase ExeA